MMQRFVYEFPGPFQLDDDVVAFRVRLFDFAKLYVSVGRTIVLEWVSFRTLQTVR